MSDAVPRPGPCIRPVTAADLEALSALAIQVFSQSFAEYLTADALHAALKRFDVHSLRQSLADHGQSWWLAEMSGRVLGYCSVRESLPPNPLPGAKPAELSRLYLHSDWHGRGLAGRLMTQAIRESRRRGADGCWLQVLEQNHRAISFYEKCGFARAGSVDVQIAGQSLPHRILFRPLLSIQAGELTIRHATASDAELLAGFATRVFTETFAPYNTRANLAAYLSQALTPAQFSSELSRSDQDSGSAHRCEFWLAWAGDALVGYYAIGDTPAPACVTGESPLELRRLYVDSAYHAGGVGPALMDHALERMRALCGRTCWLGVWEHNDRARAFCTRCGFERVGSKIFVVGNDPQHDWVMQRPL